MKAKKKGGKNEDTLPTWIIVFLSVFAGFFLIMVVISIYSPHPNYNPTEANMFSASCLRGAGGGGGGTFRWW